MKCVQCNDGDTKVIESRDIADGKTIRRRRECSSCKSRFTTYERVEKPQLIVIKNNGMQELFSRDKLLMGLFRACEKTSISRADIENVASRVEERLYECSEPEVSSSKIGQIVMDELVSVNEVAYVRFASVYRRFKDIEGFEEELSQIKNIKNSA